MNKFGINDRVYCINKAEHHIDCCVIRKIIIDDKGISYDVDLMGYNSFRSLIVEENLIGYNPDDLYQKIKDDIKKYYPLHWK